MEIALLPKNAVKLKGKFASVIVEPAGDVTGYQVALFLSGSTRATKESVIISGPGEYEIGGIKISGLKSSEGYVYSLTMDGIDILVGSLPATMKLQHKLREHHLVLLLVEGEGDAAFVTGLAMNGVLLYGDKASEVVNNFATDTTDRMSKYQVTKEKLPSEMQTILLA